jgi:hypothetical protein
MRFRSLLGVGLCHLAALVSPVYGQAKLPVISARTFTSGVAKVTVTGAFSISQDVPINVAASFGDGEMTWLQFGSSGAAEPNAGITYNAESGETGITIARGKQLATGGIMPGEKSECTGKVEVTASLVSARYTCVGLTSYDQTTRQMSKVNIEVIVTARS